MQGNLINRLMEQSTSPKPAVGMGATICCWSDRLAGTVIAVSPSGKTVTVREDTATRLDGNGMSEAQAYSFAPCPNGRVFVFRLGKRGYRGPNKGNGLLLGTRQKYHDFSF